MFTNNEKEFLNTLLIDKKIDFHNIAMSENTQKTDRSDAIKGIELITAILTKIQLIKAEVS